MIKKKTKYGTSKYWNENKEITYATQEWETGAARKKYYIMSTGGLIFRKQIKTSNLSLADTKKITKYIKTQYPKAKVKTKYIHTK